MPELSPSALSAARLARPKSTWTGPVLLEVLVCPWPQLSKAGDVEAQPEQAVFRHVAHGRNPGGLFDDLRR